MAAYGVTAPPGLIEAIEKLGTEQEFWNYHHEDFSRRYAGAWVLVNDGSVIATASSWDDLDLAFAHASGAPGSTLARFYPEPKAIWIL